jgi:ectoine hydroxylase-related dioxygenase (phytanoyl-CoA dioxygenase family)
LPTSDEDGNDGREEAVEDGDRGYDVAEQVSMRDGLTDAQVADFSADGFLLLGRLVDDEQLTVMRDIYDEVLTRDLGHRLLGTRADGTAVSQVQMLKPENHFPELWQTTYFSHGRRLAAQLLDTPEDDLRGFSHLTYKQPETGRDTPWHQDEAYWQSPELDTHEPRAVTIWTTLDDATSSSGAMSFIPGSHTGSARHVFIDEETSGLMVAEPDTAAARECPMRAGEASIHHCRTVHRACANTSAHQRRAWALEFHAAPVPRTSPDVRAWLPELYERMNRRAPLGLI